MLHIRFVLCILISTFVFSCGNVKSKSIDDIIADEAFSEFKLKVLDAEELLIQTGKYDILSRKSFESGFLLNKLTYKKHFNVRIKKTKIGVNIRFYNYDELNGASIAKENYFEKLKQYSKEQKEEGIFAIFNNYNIITLSYMCDRKKRKYLAKEIIPTLYKTFRLPDTKILNLECGDFVKLDAQLY